MLISADTARTSISSVAASAARRRSTGVPPHSRGTSICANYSPACARPSRVSNVRKLTLRMQPRKLSLTLAPGSWPGSGLPATYRRLLASIVNSPTVVPERVNSLSTWITTCSTTLVRKDFRMKGESENRTVTVLTNFEHNSQALVWISRSIQEQFQDNTHFSQNWAHLICVQPVCFPRCQIQMKDRKFYWWHFTKVVPTQLIVSKFPCLTLIVYITVIPRDDAGGVSESFRFHCFLSWSQQKNSHGQGSSKTMIMSWTLRRSFEQIQQQMVDEGSVSFLLCLIKWSRKITKFTRCPVSKNSDNLSQGSEVSVICQLEQSENTQSTFCRFSRQNSGMYLEPWIINSANKTPHSLPGFVPTSEGKVSIFIWYRKNKLGSTSIPNGTLTFELK